MIYGHYILENLVSAGLDENLSPLWYHTIIETFLEWV